MARLIQLAGGGPINEAERLVVALLVGELPESYLVIPNIEIPDSGGQRLELDVVVAAPHAVYVIETKGWGGEIQGDDREWVVDGTTRAAPIRLTSHKARVLKGKLVAEMPILQRVWVEPAVVLAFPTRSLSLSPDAR
jgi:hypothetical protein